MHPGIHAVLSHIKWYISDQLDSFAVGIFPKFSPLLEELVLAKHPKHDVIIHLFSALCKRNRLFFLNIFRPALPVLISIGYFQCHIQSIIFDPVPVFFYKLLKFRFVFVKPAKCFLQNQRPVFKECCIINGRFLCSPVIALDFLRRQKLFSDKLIQINQIRISGKCRQALIWAVPKTCRSDRKHLPVLLFQIHQQIHKMERCITQSANTIL